MHNYRGEETVVVLHHDKSFFQRRPVVLRCLSLLEVVGKHRVGIHHSESPTLCLLHQSTSAEKR